MRVIPILCAVGATLAMSSVAGARSERVAAYSCGSITVRLGGNDFSYRLRVVSGGIACRTARSVTRTFIVRSTFPRGWHCTRGHSGDAWAGSCARLSPRALVRAYLIAG